MAQLPPSPFISNSTVSPRAVGSAAALSRTSVLDAQTGAAAEAIQSSDGRRQSLADGTPELEAGLTCGSTLGLPDSSESAVASSDLQPRATAELPYRYLGNFAACEPWAAQGMSCDDCMVEWMGCWDNFQCPKCGKGELPNCNLPDLIDEPFMTNGGDQEAPASAPTKNPDVGVLAKCNCEYAHCEDFDRPDCRAKAAGLDPWPDGATDHIHEIFAGARKLLPPIDIEEIELPLFIRDGDHLRRWEA